MPDIMTPDIATPDIVTPDIVTPDIVTLCMNPALDITTGTEVVRPTNKLRCAAARYDPGGGGINVARVAQVLGAKALAVFPLGGPSGEVVSTLLAAEGLHAEALAVGIAAVLGAAACLFMCHVTLAPEGLGVDQPALMPVTLTSVNF